MIDTLGIREVESWEIAELMRKTADVVKANELEDREIWILRSYLG